ncbi:hypothetical protein ANN_12454 [Periplaneta americana]|uniref:Uncharacterized protein n=1 Tax=Periplaneta americana TaxID=6978 RepID=A0ABQ8TH67_PERAM|nr:hypothetical protein ANN_12454 [Periplaneta americana]
MPVTPDLAPSDYHLFGSVKEQLRGQRYESLEDIRKAVRQCLREDETDFYSKGIFKLTERPDLAPSDCHLFGSVKEQLRGQRYETLDDIRKAVRQCLRENETDFYSKGIFKLTKRREKCVQRNGDYVEK